MPPVKRDHALKPAIGGISRNTAPAPLRIPNIAFGIHHRPVRVQILPSQIKKDRNWPIGPSIGIKADLHNLLIWGRAEISDLAIGRKANRIGYGHGSE